MKTKAAWLILSCLMVSALVLSSCQPAVVDEQEEQTITGQVTEKEATKVDEEKKVETAKGEPVKIDYSKPQYGGTLRLSMLADFACFDPYRHDNQGLYVINYYLEAPFFADWTIDREINSLMTSYFPMDIMAGCLVESYENPDPLTYIWHVRQGVHWQNIPPVNGREFVASDLVYTYHRQCGLGSGYTEPSPYSFYDELKDIESIEATDKYTVVIKMKQPNPVFPFYWGLDNRMPIVAPEVIETYGAFGDWRDVAIGTGPFILKDYVKGNMFTFIRNPDYWGWDEKHPENKIPYVDGINLAIIGDTSTRLAALRSGKLDISGTTGVQRDNLEKSNPELKFFIRYGESKNLGMNYWAEPFTDRRVRKAMQMAIDLKTIAATYFKGYAHWFPSLLSFDSGKDLFTPFEEYPEEVQEGFTYNPERAKELLAEAGYPNGFTTNIVTRGFYMVDLIEVAQAYLAEIGVTLEINAMEYAAGNAFLYGRQHDQMYWFRSSIACDPLSCLTYWHTPVTWNWGDISDPIFDKYCEDIKLETDVTKRKQLIKEANVYGTSQFWGAFMPQEQSFNVGQPWLMGWQGEGLLGGFQPAGVYARIWLDQELQSR